MSLSQQSLDLMPDSPEEQALCDMYAEHIQDYELIIRPWICSLIGLAGTM